jgi:hypothetical protein
MSSSSGPSGLRLGGFIVGGIGLVFTIAGLLVALYMPGMIAAEHQRLRDLPSPDSVSITDTPAGREVIVEGTIVADQPARFRDFVAYKKEEERRDAKERERSGKWQTVERVSPPLRLVSGEGIMGISGDYGIRAATQWQDTSKVIDTMYSGLRAREPVYVVGRAAAGGVEADVVGSGTRESYLASVAGGAGVAWWLGVGFTALGMIMLNLGIAFLIMAARKGPSDAPDAPAAAR